MITAKILTKFALKYSTMFLFASGLVSYINDMGALIIIVALGTAAFTWTLHDSIYNSEVNKT